MTTFLFRLLAFFSLITLSFGQLTAAQTNWVKTNAISDTVRFVKWANKAPVASTTLVTNWVAKNASQYATETNLSFQIDSLIGYTNRPMNRTALIGTFLTVLSSETNQANKDLMQNLGLYAITQKDFLYSLDFSKASSRVVTVQRTYGLSPAQSVGITNLTLTSELVEEIRK